MRLHFLHLSLRMIRVAVDPSSLYPFRFRLPLLPDRHHNRGSAIFPCSLHKRILRTGLEFQLVRMYNDHVSCDRSIPGIATNEY